MDIKYFSAFTGIGGFDLSLKELGCECVGWSETDPYAIKTFEINFPKLKGLNYGDITEIDTSTIPDFNLLVGGSPCQSFSVAGKRKGLEGISGLFYSYLKILQDKQPDNFIWENVKGVLSSNNRDDWGSIVLAFQKLGYWFKTKVLNTKDYGVPQSRERVFVVGQRLDVLPFGFKFPIPVKLKIALKDILEEGFTDKEVAYCIDANYSRTSEINLNWYLKNRRQIIFNSPVQITGGRQGERVYSVAGTSVCLTANSGGRGGKTGLCLLPKGIIRKLTPLECFRLQGFPDSFVEKAKKQGVSNTQLYKQAGNAVTVDVVRAILKRLYLEDAKLIQGELL